MPSTGLGQLSSRAIRGMFYEELEMATAMSWIDMIANLFTSDQESETYRWLSQSPKMREWLNGRHAKGFSVNGISIENLEFEATIEFFLKELRRDKTGQVRIRLGELVDRSQSHWASLLTTLIENGNAVACYDGQYFFDTDHSEGSSGTMKNLLAAGDYAELNVGTPTNPTPGEMADVLMKLIQHLYSLKDDQGEPRNETALKFLAMVPINLWGATATAISSNQLTASTGSRDNPLKGQKFSIEVVPNPRLTWTTDLAVFRTDARAKPFIRQTEKEVELKILGDGSDLEFNENKWQVGIDASRNVGYGMWWQAVRGTLS